MSAGICSKYFDSVCTGSILTLLLFNSIIMAELLIQLSNLQIFKTLGIILLLLDFILWNSEVSPTDSKTLWDHFISFLWKGKCAKKICCCRKYCNLLCIYLSVCMQPKEIFGNRVKNESARESRKREIWKKKKRLKSFLFS